MMKQLKISKKVNIRPGSKEGTRYKFRGLGKQISSGEVGDFIFQLKESKNDTFYREGNDIVMKKSIPISKALGGCEVDVCTLDDKQFTIKINSIIKPGFRYFIKGEGMSIDFDWKNRGALVIEFQIEFPEYVDSQKKAILKETLKA